MIQRKDRGITNWALVVLTLGLHVMPIGPAMAARRVRAKIPLAIVANLDRRFPGWRLAVPRDELQWIADRLYHGSLRDMCIAKADFDGNGEIDCAVFIQTGPTADDARLILFLQRGRRYWHRTLERGLSAGEMFVSVAAKGSRGYNYETDRHFVYARPTLEFGSEKGGYSYLYESRRFRRVITSD